MSATGSLRQWPPWLVRLMGGRRLAILVPTLWLLIFFLVPFLIVFGISFSETRIAMPPYAPLVEWAADRAIGINLNPGNYAFLFTDDLYLDSWLYSVKVAAVSALWCLVIGYPLAHAIARTTSAWRNVLLLLVILPFWTSLLLRVYAWVGLLKNNGVINNVLMMLDLIDQPLMLMQSDFAMYIAIVYSYLPFMILPLYANLERHDATLAEAAADLGARPLTVFLRLTLPLSMPGIVAGLLLVFIPAVGEFVIPSLLGRADQLMIGRMLAEEFFANRDWPVASAVAIVLLLLLLLPIMVFQRYQTRELESDR